MADLVEGVHPVEFIMSEASGQRSRDAITVTSGAGVVDAGTLLKKIAEGTGAVTVGDPAFDGTGDGVLTKATPAYGAGVKAGVYSIVNIEPAANGGTFQVNDPDGVQIGIATVGVAFDGDVKFTIADGATDFVAGDTFTLAVTIADAATAGEYAPAQAGEVADAVSMYKVDATSAAVDVAAIVRDAELNKNCLNYHSSADDDAKKAALRASLAAVGIICR